MISAFPHRRHFSLLTNFPWTCRGSGLFRTDPVETAPPAECPISFRQRLASCGWGFWRAHDIGCWALLSSSSCSLTGPAAFHHWDDSRCFCHCAMTQGICSEETQNNPGDKYTKEADLIQVRTAIYKHTFHPQRSFFLVHTPNIHTLCYVADSVLFLSLIAMKQTVGHRAP